MKKEKILIVSYYFYEENTPRSHRAFQLARELTNYYDVKVITTKKHIPESFFNKYNINVNYVKNGFLFNKSFKSFSKIRDIQKKHGLKKIIIKVFKKIYEYLFWDRQIEAFYFFYKYLKNERNNYKAIISISFPFSTHLGVYLSLIRNKNMTKNLILEYGDPFYYNKSFHIAYYFRIIESIILKKANFIVLPIEKASNSFKKYNVEKKIKIIPQGFKLDEYKLDRYKKNTIPTFMYAGVFYEKIRNPIKILKSLNKIEENFKFIIHTDKLSLEKTDCGKLIINEIKKSKGKIELKDSISREKCIKEMSKMDFLLNISNLNQDQSPSKLIDYSIAKRPILSFNQDTFCEKIFLEFLHGNFHNQVTINLENYDIKKIGKQYKTLIDDQD